MACWSVEKFDFVSGATEWEVSYKERSTRECLSNSTDEQRIPAAMSATELETVPPKEAHDEILSLAIT